ncbi:cytochrome c oxidase assembly protein [bacterium RCC_150]
MPPLNVVLTAWTVNWPALFILVSAAVLYSKGLIEARRRNIRWPLWNTLAFFVLGLGSFAILSFGFPGTFSHDLRWAFTLKVTSYLFVVPLLVGLGKPLTLARRTLGPAGSARVEAVLGHRLVRLLSNTLVAALLGLAMFTVFLTPFFYVLRTNPFADVALTLLVPLIGLLMTVPIMEDGAGRTGSLIVVEFIFVFIELLADAVPGVLMRLSPGILDGATSVMGNQPAWFPSPLRDQQLSGDLMWFLAEVVDLPLIILMFVRFSRTDKREAKSFDDLSDEEIEALNRAHLGQGGRSFD